MRLEVGVVVLDLVLELHCTLPEELNHSWLCEELVCHDSWKESFHHRLMCALLLGSSGAAAARKGRRARHCNL
jgi:hypothetical protein